VSARLEGLLASTTYHYRVVATNAGGTGTGTDGTLTTLPERPTVSSVTPALGPEAGGTSVTIGGSNLSGASAVMFGSSSASSFTVASPTSITASAPPGSGSVQVTVTTSGGTSATNTADHFGYLAPPTVTALSPIRGPVEGGTTVRVSGTGFVVARTTVMFASGAATGVTVKSATSLTATDPAHAAGPVDVTVATPGGTSATSTADRFKYAPTIAAVRPNAGPTAGGTTVTVTGSGFETGSKATVFHFGTAKASSVSCASSSECTVVSPANPAGQVHVTATVNSVISSETAADLFTYS
jgi:hypothetical protein